jgi:hypothetical protein
VLAVPASHVTGVVAILLTIASEGCAVITGFKARVPRAGGASG